MGIAGKTFSTVAVTGKLPQGGFVIMTNGYNPKSRYGGPKPDWLPQWDWFDSPLIRMR
jgi:hypothetical protein